MNNENTSAILRTSHTGLSTGQFSNVCQSMLDPTGRQSGTRMDLLANTSVSLPANHYDTNALYTYGLQLHLRKDTGSCCTQVFSVSKQRTKRRQREINTHSGTTHQTDAKCLPQTPNSSSGEDRQLAHKKRYAYQKEKLQNIRRIHENDRQNKTT